MEPPGFRPAVGRSLIDTRRYHRRRSLHPMSGKPFSLRRVLQLVPWLALVAVIAVRAEDSPARTHPFDLVSATVDDLAKQAYAILKANCFECHGAPKRSGLDMRTPESLGAGGSEGQGIVGAQPRSH